MLVQPDQKHSGLKHGPPIPRSLNCPDGVPFRVKRLCIYDGTLKREQTLQSRPWPPGLVRPLRTQSLSSINLMNCKPRHQFDERVKGRRLDEIGVGTQLVRPVDMVGVRRRTEDDEP